MSIFVLYYCFAHVFSYHIPAVFLSLISSGWLSESALLFFWCSFNAAHWWKSHFSYRNLTSGRLENASRYFCARIFHIFPYFHCRASSYASRLPLSLTANDSHGGRTCVQACTREFGINERFLLHLKTRRVMPRILIRSTFVTFMYNRCLLNASIRMDICIFSPLSRIFCLWKVSSTNKIPSAVCGCMYMESTVVLQFTEVAKKLDRDLKIILLDYWNNCVGYSSWLLEYQNFFQYYSFCLSYTYTIILMVQ